MGLCLLKAGHEFLALACSIYARDKTYNYARDKTYK
jgi:hypothetical protein